MSTRLEQIVEQAMSLPIEARADLANRLVESLDPADAGPYRGMWVQEARRRLTELRTGSVKGVPGDAAVAQLRQKYAE